MWPNLQRIHCSLKIPRPDSKQINTANLDSTVLLPITLTQMSFGWKLSHTLSLTHTHVCLWRCSWMAYVTLSPRLYTHTSRPDEMFFEKKTWTMTNPIREGWLSHGEKDEQGEKREVAGMLFLLFALWGLLVFTAHMWKRGKKIWHWLHWGGPQRQAGRQMNTCINTRRNYVTHRWTRRKSRCSVCNSWT